MNTAFICRDNGIAGGWDKVGFTEGKTYHGVVVRSSFQGLRLNVQNDNGYWVLVGAWRFTRVQRERLSCCDLQRIAEQQYADEVLI